MTKSKPDVDPAEERLIADELRGSGCTRPVDLKKSQKKSERSLDEMYERLVDRGYTV